MAAPMPTGMLMKKIHGQDTLSVIQPPSSGPITGATRVVIDHSAIARPASAGG
ncbi:hypothetical protein GALL_459140 [mine drainage metagenome]|uniref:Uncharacterized protein n=1 Tax=mine drainage metagenome TaxID=410659 RepID=A0A1J5PLQ0_9ZZZZ